MTLRVRKRNSSPNAGSFNWDLPEHSKVLSNSDAKSPSASVTQYCLIGPVFSRINSPYLRKIRSNGNANLRCYGINISCFTFSCKFSLYQAVVHRAPVCTKSLRCREWGPVVDRSNSHIICESALTTQRKKECTCNGPCGCNNASSFKQHIPKANNSIGISIARTSGPIMSGSSPTTVL